MAKEITIKISWGRVFVLLLICYVIASYPFHYYMMCEGDGMYDNEPTKEWKCNCFNPADKVGPCATHRTVALIFSPFILPINGVYLLAERTYPMEGYRAHETTETEEDSGDNSRTGWYRTTSGRSAIRAHLRERWAENFDLQGEPRGDVEGSVGGSSSGDRETPELQAVDG